MTEDQWHEYQKRSRKWSIRIEHHLLHSAAYRDLTYAPALKVLCWFHEKIKLNVNKRKRGRERYTVLNNGDIEFTYREASFRGLTSHKFRNALRALHLHGFIDVRKPGSALKGDFTSFALSDRWKAYGTGEFVAVEYPRSVVWVNFGFKREEKS